MPSCSRRRVRRRTFSRCGRSRMPALSVRRPSTVSLATQPRLANLVPASQSFVAGPARVLAQEFIGGTALDVVLRGRGRPVWHELAAEVLRSTNALRAAIGELALAAGGSHGLAVLRPDLELLAGLGVDAVTLRKLAVRAAGRTCRCGRSMAISGRAMCLRRLTAGGYWTTSPADMRRHRCSTSFTLCAAAPTRPLEAGGRGFRTGPLPVALHAHWLTRFDAPLAASIRAGSRLRLWPIRSLSSRRCTVANCARSHRGSRARVGRTACTAGGGCLGAGVGLNPAKNNASLARHHWATVKHQGWESAGHTLSVSEQAGEL